MPFSMHALVFDALIPTLDTLDKILAKGEESAKQRGFDPDLLASARLAPDMVPLARQIDFACVAVATVPAHVLGEAPAKEEPSAATMAAMRARVAGAIARGRALPAGTLDGHEDRRVKIPLTDGMYLDMTALEYVNAFAMPNFYFHVVTAYDILRNAGVPLGKRDYLMHVGPFIRKG